MDPSELSLEELATLIEELREKNKKLREIVEEQSTPITKLKAEFKRFKNAHTPPRRKGPGETESGGSADGDSGDDEQSASTGNDADQVGGGAGITVVGILRFVTGVPDFPIEWISIVAGFFADSFYVYLIDFFSTLEYGLSGNRPQYCICTVSLGLTTPDAWGWTEVAFVCGIVERGFFHDVTKFGFSVVFGYEIGRIGDRI